MGCRKCLHSCILPPCGPCGEVGRVTSGWGLSVVVIIELTETHYPLRVSLGAALGLNQMTHLNFPNSRGRGD
jgi:hypothetical protein